MKEQSAFYPDDAWQHLVFRALGRMGCGCLSMSSLTATLAHGALFETAFDARASVQTVTANQPSLRLALPWLGGAQTERLFPEARAAGRNHGFFLWETDGLLMGTTVQPVGSSLRRTTREVYERLFRASVGWPLYRIWNYVPGINAVQRDRENYQAFCEGRAEAFETAHGSGFKRALPAASAVGCAGGELTVIFVAGRRPALHIENPEQVPAYEYPREHGPRPPSFSRATLASTESGRQLVFVSGTAAIKGHATVAPRELEPQLDSTLDNLRLISRAAGLGDTLGAEMSMERHFKVYMRDLRAYRTIRDRLESDLVRISDRVVYLQADICRAALEVEIEASLIEKGEAKV